MSRLALTRWLRSINAQLLLWAILPVIVLLGGLGFAGIYTHQQEMAAFVAERDTALALAYARMLASWLQTGAIAGDGQDLHQRVALLRQSHPALLVLDAGGRILSHPDPARIGTQLPEHADLAAALAAGRETVVLDTDQGDATLFAMSSIPASGWVLVVFESAHAGMSPILRYSSLGPIVIGVSAVLAGLVLTFGWRTIVQPLCKLSRAAEQTNWTLDVPAMDLPRNSVVEVVTLHRALMEAVARVRSYQTGIRDYLNAVTDAQEAERARLAREIHDGTLQELIALAQRLDIAQRALERGELERARALLLQVRETGVATAEDLRRILSDLRPAYLEDLGFLPALEVLVRDADRLGSTRVRLEHEGSLQRLPPAVELAAYRIAQEALNNALRHAHASEITVRLVCLEGALSLEIIDNGTGFVLPDHLDLLTHQRHFGLISIRERAAQVSGTFALRSHPGVGTTIHVILPGCADSSA